MDLAVEYKDQLGSNLKQVHKLTRLAFAKHLAVAGQGYAPNAHKFIRTIAMFFHYSFYLKRQAFNDGKFSQPPVGLSDPTEKGQFSNLAGKSIADFLSKRIDKSLFTVNYEAAMRLKNIPISGGRPDLIAFKSNKTSFAIEAKGYAGGYRDMESHKIQSKSGSIPVNFTVACVSYNLYDNVQCNYFDPSDGNVPFDDALFSLLTRNYYKGLSEFLNERYFQYREVEYQGEAFYEIDLSYRIFEKIFSEDISFMPFRYLDIFRFYRPRLILPRAIRIYAENGLTSDILPFLFEADEQSSNIYIDNDRVGLRVNSVI